MKVLGLDVGNAKLKLCFVESGGALREDGVRWTSMPIPFTTDRRRDFAIGVPGKLRMAGQLLGFDPDALDAVVACSSHAYSFPRLHESVAHLAGVLDAMLGPRAHLVAVDGALTTARAVARLAAPALRAHAVTNFVGSAVLGARLVRDGLVVDIGTTSTEITPIVGGAIDPAGLADRHDYLRYRYLHHRLAWYGLTATPIAMIAPEITTPRGTYQVVARGHGTDAVFALRDDVDPDLMREHAYLHAFPDRERARAELAQVIGLDPELVDDAELLAVRDFVHQRLVDRIAELIGAVVREALAPPIASVDVAVFALGEGLLARPALIRAGVDPARIRTLAFGRAQALWSASSAFGVALLALEHALGRRVDVA